MIAVNVPLVKVGTNVAAIPPLSGADTFKVALSSSYPAPPSRMSTDLICPSLTVALITADAVGDPPLTVMFTINASAVAPVPSPVIVIKGVSLYLLPLSLMNILLNAPPSTTGVPDALVPFVVR